MTCSWYFPYSDTDTVIPNTYSCLWQVALKTISGEYLHCYISLSPRQLDINSIFMVWPSVRLACNNNDLIHVKRWDFKITGLSFSNYGNSKSYRLCQRRLDCKLDGKSWHSASRKVRRTWDFHEDLLETYSGYD